MVLCEAALAMAPAKTSCAGLSAAVGAGDAAGAADVVDEMPSLAALAAVACGGTVMGWALSKSPAVAQGCHDSACEA